MKMKKIEDFIKEKVELKTIYGGGTVFTDTRYVNGDGCNVSVSDQFEDNNGNGAQDSNESASFCIDVVCKPIPASAAP
jgi:hypothetical protein